MSVSTRNVVVYFKPWRPLTAHEQVVLDRVMREAAVAQVRDWDRIDSNARLSGAERNKDAE